MMSEEADEPRVEVSRPAFNLEGFHHGRKRKKDGERDQSGEELLLLHTTQPISLS